MVRHSYDEMNNVPDKMTGAPQSLNALIRFNLWGGGGKFEHGIAAVELVFFLVIFVLVFFGSVELAREISVKHALDVGTYRAARYLSLVPGDAATARAMIQSELDNNVLGGAGAVQVNVDMPCATFQCLFSVTAQVPYQPVIPLMVFAPKTLSVTHEQSIEAYP
jgi:Flp pilus assembly protein TadG